ncbi:glycosyltransferase family 2 protein [Kineococcus sp. LSe6-4]|uniref:Glycosyltransferase family 2 protein n=1 Tax=Kineococcus halophytocola TaxID=3234027 RepID=A0ABV4H4L8_9ACTN
MRPVGCRTRHDGRTVTTSAPSPAPSPSPPAGPGFDDTWVVVPLFCEASVIAGVVRGLRERFRYVVCVDDGSTDGSGAQAEAAGAVVVRHAVNLGQGAALQTGIAYALRDPRTRSVVTFDADGQHRVEDAVAMVARLEAEDLDVVFGSRFLDRRTELDRLKRLVLRAAVVYTNRTTGLRLTDAHNGLRVFSRRGAQTLRIRHNRMAHASEIVHQVGRSDLRWAEQPVHVLYTAYSRSKGQSVLNSINILVETLLG